MTVEEASNWYKQQLSEGVPEADLEKALKSTGYSQKQVKEIKQKAKGGGKQEKEKEKKKPSKKPAPPSETPKKTGKKTAPKKTAPPAKAEKTGKPGEVAPPVVLSEEEKPPRKGARVPQPGMSSGSHTRGKDIKKQVQRFRFPLLVIIGWAVLALIVGIVNIFIPLRGWISGASINIFGGTMGNSLSLGETWFGESALGFFPTVALLLTLWVGWDTVKTHAGDLKDCLKAGMLFGLVIGFITKVLEVLFVFINALHNSLPQGSLKAIFEGLPDAIGDSMGVVFSDYMGIGSGFLSIGDFVLWGISMFLGIIIISVIEGGLLSMLSGILAGGKLE